MIVTRRHFLKAGAIASVVLAHRASADPMGLLPRTITRSAPPMEDPRCKQLVHAALDAARGNGADYADVRLTHTVSRFVNPSSTGITDGEVIAIGVRALVHGVWGFASSAVWSTEEAVRLGREAAAQAKINDWSSVAGDVLAPVPIIQDGHWATPVTVDPFAIYPVDLLDYLQGLAIHVGRSPDASVAINTCAFGQQDKAFGSTEGSYYTQRSSTIEGYFEIHVTSARRHVTLRRAVETLTPSGGGFELYDGQPIRDNIDRVIEELREDVALPLKPVTSNRYGVVIDALSIGRILNGTVGAATELDRALGYEANAGGTSYLADPPQMVGTYHIGAPLLSVTANRTEPGGVASVQWDDDGAPAQAFPLVQDGILAGYQTTREGAHWLSERTPRPVLSRGCAYASDALTMPLTHTANLVMRPGSEGHTLDALVRQLGNGVVFRNMRVMMDFQQGSGTGDGMAYEVKNGKRIARFERAMIPFRTTELWKQLRALGGTNTARRYGMTAQKGEPVQDGAHSVTAVPALFDKMIVIDAKKQE